MTEGLDSPARQTADVMLVMAFSLFSSLMALATPLFALQVFDRVLSSRSLETLGTLCAVLALVLAAAGVLDHARKRVLARLVTQWAASRLRPAIAADLRSPAGDARRSAELLQRVSGARAISAITDMPWMALFLLALYLLHPALALLGCTGICLLLGEAALAWRARTPPDPAQPDIPLPDRLAANAGDAFAVADAARTGARWAKATDHDDGPAARRETVGTLRMLLQSGVIALGAALVIGGQISPGMIVAASFLMARLLAPLEAVTQNQALLRQVWRAYRVLKCLPRLRDTETGRAAAPASLRVSSLSLPLPGNRVLSDVSFSAKSSDLIGITGAAGAGKSALAAALCGFAAPIAGHVARQGKARDARLMRQDCAPGQGGVADLVAADRPDPGGRLAAEAMQLATTGQLAGERPDLSSGAHDAPRSFKRQICLARTFFGDPGLVVLDEPERDLDIHALASLRGAIDVLRQRGAIVVLLSQRPALLRECDQLVVLDQGRQIASGPPGDVLAFNTQPKPVAI